MEKVSLDVSREVSTPRARILRPLQHSSSIRPPGVSSVSKDRSSFWDRSHSFLDSEELLSVRLRHFEATLQAQQGYTLLLKAELDESRRETDTTHHLTSTLHSEITKDRVEERKRWEDYISDYKSIVNTIIASKDGEIKKLNEVLSVWVDRFVQLQEQVNGQGGPGGTEEMRRLCMWTVREVRGNRGLPPKAMAVAEGIGDAPPILDVDSPPRF